MLIDGRGAHIVCGASEGRLGGCSIRAVRYVQFRRIVRGWPVWYWVPRCARHSPASHRWKRLSDYRRELTGQGVRG